MRRLALLAAAVLAVAAAPAARAEPLDVDLSRLGPPSASAWLVINPGQASLASAYAQASRRRFAVLSSQVGLALSSAILHPASTTGHSGFAVDLEGAVMSADPDPVGVATAGFSSSPWTGTERPDTLYLPSVHVRKGLPFSFEIGGRLVYLAMSNYFAGQGEVKWAVNEGFSYAPDVAVRAAYTRLFGAKDWNLSVADFDLMVSKRFGLMGVTSLTPYVVARVTYLYASSERIDFAPGLAASGTDLSTTAEFPRFVTNVYRTTAGVRFTAYSVALTAEATYFSGSKAGSKSYDGARLASSFGGAAKLGWEW